MPRAAGTALALAALLLGGCVTERSKALVMIPEGALAAPGADGPSPAPSRGRAARRDPASPPPGAVPPESRVPPPVATRAVAAAAAPAAGPAPGDGAGPYLGHRPLPEGASLEQALRERFLNAETTVEAERATVYVPPALAAQARLSGTSVVEEAPGRRVATGAAVLVLRRLTVRASRLALVERGDGTPDVSLVARGRVAFHADLPASVIDERDLRSLVLRNDGYTPLR